MIGLLPQILIRIIMNPFRNVFTCGLFLLLCGGGALAQMVQTDYDHNFNLAKFKTFGFHQQERRPGDPLAASPINDHRIHDALDLQLRTSGFGPSEQPDFWIAYYVTTRKGLDIQDNRFGLWQRMGSVNVNQVTEGTSLWSLLTLPPGRKFGAATLPGPSIQRTLTRTSTRRLSS